MSYSFVVASVPAISVPVGPQSLFPVVPLSRVGRCSRMSTFLSTMMLLFVTLWLAITSEPSAALPAPAVTARRHIHHEAPAPAPTPAEQPQPEAVGRCPGIPYDFSTSNYCQAAVLSSTTYKQPTPPAGVASLKLRSLQLISRHGDRTPVNIAPTNDVNYDFCDTTASTGYYNHPPPTSAEAASEGIFTPDEKHTATSRIGDSSNQEGRRLEQIPYLIPVGVTNPYGANLWQGSCNTGQLTTLGVQQHISVGQGLRSVYVDMLNLLPQTFVRGNTSFYLRSTDIWRTKQSAEALLSGLWPTQTLENADVIPFHSFPLEIETMFANPTACPEIAKIQAAQRQEPAWVAHLNHPEIWNVLNRVMGVKALPAWQASYDHVLDNFRVRQCHGLPLPCTPGNPKDCITQDLADYVYAQGDWEYAYASNESPLATPLAQIGISGFMAVIRDTLIAQATGDASKSTIGNPNFAYYSGHDTTLSAVLGSLNVTGMTWPPYASTMFWELWQDEAKVSTDNMYVRIMYNAQPLKLFAAGCCDDLCPYSNVVNYLNSMIPTNVAEICQAGRRGA